MANFNLNKVILGGRLTADPELRMAGEIPVTSFSIAVNRRYQSKRQDGQQATTDFINCTAWRSNAEFITRYFHKGSSICVVGQIQTRSWTDQQGQKRYATDVLVDEAYFVDSKGEGGGSASGYGGDSYGAPTYSGGGQPTATAAPKFEEISDDDDLPF
ncbi:MAG: single-stranded DNA-binding protein [Firmicutes bacterium]|nr:single-stranded DNA-binding protein [Bacillota bacterium]